MDAKADLKAIKQRLAIQASKFEDNARNLQEILDSTTRLTKTEKLVIERTIETQRDCQDDLTGVMSNIHNDLNRLTGRAYEP